MTPGERATTMQKGASVSTRDKHGKKGSTFFKVTRWEYPDEHTHTREKPIHKTFTYILKSVMNKTNIYSENPKS